AQAAESRLRDAIDSVPEAFVLWDRTGRLLLSNRNFREFFGLDPKVISPGVRRDHLTKLMQLAVLRESPPAPGAASVREAELTGGRWLQIAERRTADGGLVMTAADITAIKTQEEARRLNEIELQNTVMKLEKSQQE